MISAGAPNNLAFMAAEESPANLRDWLPILSRNLAVNKIDMAVKFSDYNSNYNYSSWEIVGLSCLMTLFIDF